MANAELRSTVSRLVAELAVIIAGVLIALAVDAWWESVRDSELEREALSSLAFDLTNAAEQVTTLISRDKAIVEQATQLLEGGLGPLRGLTNESMRNLFATVPYELRLRTYDELHSIGRLRLFSNRELRLLLTDFDAKAQSLIGYERQMERQWNQTARPLLYRTISFELIFTDQDRAIQSSGTATNDPPESDLFDLRNAMTDRANFATVHGRLLGRIAELLTKIQALTTSDLQRKAI